MIDHSRGTRFYFDTTVFCEAFEGRSDRAEALKSFFELGKRAPKRIVTSELTLAELSVRRSWGRLSRFYSDLLVFHGSVDLKSISRSVLLETGDYRRSLGQTDRKVKLHDAIHAVTAVQARCRYLVTSDKGFPLPRHLERLSSDPADLHRAMKLLDA